MFDSRGGVSKQEGPYMVYRMKLPEAADDKKAFEVNPGYR
jgi:hypothetical protein